MEILFRTEKLREQCNVQQEMVKAFGKAITKKLRVRLDDLHAAPCLEALRNLPGRCHELKGNRKGQLAIGLDGRHRLIIEPANDPVSSKPDGGLDWRATTTVRILDIVDYHE